MKIATSMFKLLQLLRYGHIGQVLRLTWMLIAVTLTGVTSDLVDKPKNTYVISGSSTYLNCSTNIPNSSVYWQYYFTLANIYNVYNSLQVNQLFSNHIMIENYTITSSTGTSYAFNLVFLNTSLADAGTYTCQDSYGTGSASGASLVILGSGNVTCLASNTAVAIYPNVSLSWFCSITYSGTYAPFFNFSNCDMKPSSVVSFINSSYVSSQVTLISSLGRPTVQCSLFANFSANPRPQLVSPDNTPLSWTSTASYYVHVYTPVQPLTISPNSSPLQLPLGANLTAYSAAYPPAKYEWVDLNTSILVSNLSVLTVTKLGSQSILCTAWNTVTGQNYMEQSNITFTGIQSTQIFTQASVPPSLSTPQPLDQSGNRSPPSISTSEIQSSVVVPVALGVCIPILVLIIVGSGVLFYFYVVKKKHSVSPINNNEILCSDTKLEKKK